MSKWHGGKGTRLYRIWKGMKTRCYNANFKAYPRYGGRGIVVCDEWKNDFPVFRDWAEKSGYDDALTIDRIDNNLGYCPSNCRWATYKEQANNTRRNKTLRINGVNETVAEACSKRGVNPFLVYDRLRLGWVADESILTPARPVHKQEERL